MINRNDIIDALTKCSGYDSAHTPLPSEVVVMAWLEHFEDFPGVTRDDLLQAVKEYHRTPSDVQIQPAHISAIARKYGRERYERSALDSAERLRLEEMSNAKAAPEAEGGALPPGSPTELAALNSGYVVPASQLESLRTAEGRMAAINAFASRVGKPAPEIEDRYLAKLAQERRAKEPIKIPCPDCSSLEPCEHDDQEVAEKEESK